MPEQPIDSKYRDQAIRETAGLVSQFVSLIVLSGQPTTYALWAVHVVRLCLEAQLRGENAVTGEPIIEAAPAAAQELYDAIRSMPMPSPLHFAKPAGNA